MANGQAAPRKGLTWLLMGLAIVAIAGLMGWLAMQSQSRDTVVAAADTTAVDGQPMDTGGPAQVVSDTVLEAQLREFRGQDVQVDMRVSAGLSPQAFWAEFPSGQPFLVQLDSALVAGGMVPPTSGQVTVVGRILEKDATTLARWMETGVLQNEDQRMLAEFGTSYMEARRVRPR